MGRMGGEVAPVQQPSAIGRDVAEVIETNDDGPQKGSVGWDSWIQRLKLFPEPRTDLLVGLQAQVVVAVHQVPSDLLVGDGCLDFEKQAHQLIDGVIAELLDEVPSSSLSDAPTVIHSR